MNPWLGNRKFGLRSAVSRCLIVFVLNLISCVPVVQADEMSGLVAESASLDVAKTPDEQMSEPPSNPMTLYGSVKKHQTSLDASAEDNASKPESEQAANDQQSLFNLAVKKLAAGEELTSEEYRSLGVGCVGYESNRTFFQPIGKITVVYHDSPAYNAGIRKGDKIVSEEKDEEAKADPTQPRYQITLGQAGTSAQMTLLSHGQPVVYTLTRMNVEDIQEPEIRQTWENIIRNLGYPKSGAFTGTSLQSLKFAPSISTEKVD